MRIPALVAAAAATLLASWWLREPRVSYLVATLVATAVAAFVGWRPRGARPWLIAFVVAALAFAVPAFLTERTLLLVERDWPRARAEHARAAEQAIAHEVGAAASALTDGARRALDAPRTRRAAFDAVAATLPDGKGERAIVLSESGRPFAWAGTVRVPLDSLDERLGVATTPFYVLLYAVAERGTRRAVATELLHAAPPADVLAHAAERSLTDRDDGWSFDFASPRGALDSAWRVINWRGTPVVALRSRAPAPETVLTRTVERGRAEAAPGVVLFLIAAVGAAWRRSRHAPRYLLVRRLVSLVLPLLALQIVPLSALSNVTHLFDPAVFFVERGGRFASSLGALALTGTVLLLALFALLRSGRRFVSRPLAALLVAAIAGVTPYLLRDLARGIEPPPLGTTVKLWVAWQLALFLPASALLIAGATAGRVALGGRRGAPPFVAPLIGAVAALLGPLIWGVPAGWPRWYPLLWIAAVVALALTRHTRRIVVAAAAVAALGATTLVWSVVAAKRVELALGDVQSLTAPDPNAERLLERFWRDVADAPTPSTTGDLLKLYAVSSLAAADYPVWIASWTPSAAGDRIGAELTTTSAAIDSSAVRALVAGARMHGEPTIATMFGDAGATQVLALPHPDGRVTTVVAFPRTRLLPESPLVRMLGLRVRDDGDPPYVVTLERQPALAAVDTVPRFTRDGNEVHGDWNVRVGDGWSHAHIEVELRPLDALGQRGALLVLLDVLLVSALWAVPAAADGALLRRARVLRAAWARSYRARLIIALFTFFVVPAATFAVWSYRQLLSGDRQSREVLVRETLRTAAAEAPNDGGSGLTTLGTRLGTPLLVYEGGELRRASDPVLFDVAPLGLLLPPEQTLSIALGNEESSNVDVPIGTRDVLFGFRYAHGVAGARLVLAAPARAYDLALDQRRSDLAFLVTLVTAGGALAALWLSGLAARELERPVGTLRRAALAIAAGEREPGLGTEPPAEFRPVFTAFRRMAADLSESRSALEAAQRRTSAVLRNVASGVLAVRDDAHVTIANPRAELLVGAALPAGAALRAVCPPALVARVEAFLARAREGARDDARDVAADDEEFDLELHGRQLRGRLTRLATMRAGEDGAVLTLDDLTDLARAQRVLAWGEMARQVAHEIKNPLTPIRLGVQHLRRAYADRRGNFEEILDRNVERVLAEIDRLDQIARAFSRYGTAPEQGPPGLPTDVAAVARDVVALERLGQTTVAWEIEGDEAPVYALAREDELREVLLNLLENARLAHATTVRVGVESVPTAAVLRITDDGEGIDEAVQARVFEPHFSTRTSGSGLGLAISRRMIEGWGGTITLRSTRGVGTVVTVSLRLASDDIGARDGSSRHAHEAAD